MISQKHKSNIADYSHDDMVSKLRQNYDKTTTALRRNYDETTTKLRFEITTKLRQNYENILNWKLNRKLIEKLNENKIPNKEHPYSIRKNLIQDSYFESYFGPLFWILIN